MTCAPSEDSDQSLRSMRSVGSQNPMFRHADRCPGWSESSLGAQVISLALSCCGSILVFGWDGILVVPYSKGWEYQNTTTVQCTLYLPQTLHIQSIDMVETLGSERKHNHLFSSHMQNENVNCYNSCHCTAGSSEFWAQTGWVEVLE